MAEKRDIVLIVDDDAAVQSVLYKVICSNGIDAKIATSGEQALELVSRSHFDLILLDVNMHGIDGFEVIRILRERGVQTPIIIVSGRQEDYDTLYGLDIGADDYVTKPFEMRELLARIEAVLRRTDRGQEQPKARRLVFDKLIIDMDAFELTVNGKKVDTPPKEMELLYYLASSPNRVYTRNQLLDEVWGFDYFGDSRTVDVHVKRLREKLEGVSESWTLKTVWGVGYKFEVV